MYEKVVKDLREAECVTNGRIALWGQAADAIEELQYNLDIAVRAEAAAIEACKPRWIPVTERLPENLKFVIAFIERNAWLDEELPYRKREIAIGYHVNGLWHVDGRSAVDCIAWMPLPEPPKEGT